MRKPNEDFSWLKLPANLEGLEVFRAFISRKADEVSFPLEALFKVELVLEELLVNVISYAYPNGQAGMVEVGCGVQDGDLFCIRIRDRGRSFNPLSLPPPDVTLDLQEREIGGLGIYFVLQMAHNLHYERAGEWNEFTFCFRLSEPTENSPPCP